MQDRQLYAQILGIESPWRVDRVGLAREQQEVHIYLEHKAGVAWRRRQCGRECALDHQPQRRWRHLATCQYRTILPRRRAARRLSRAWRADGEAALGRAV